MEDRCWSLSSHIGDVTDLKGRRGQHGHLTHSCDLSTLGAKPNSYYRCLLQLTSTAIRIQLSVCLNRQILKLGLVRDNGTKGNGNIAPVSQGDSMLNVT